MLAVGLFVGLPTPLVRAQLTIVAANTSNTGQDGNGNLLAPGTADPLWQLVGYDNSYGFSNITYGAPTSTSNSVPSTIPESSYVVENPPGAWATYPGAAEFISATPNQANGGMPGTFIYQISFTSPVGGLVTFSGNASADNGLRIVYDGTTEATFGGQLVLSTTPGWKAGLSTNGGTNAAIPTGGSVYGENAVPFSYTAPVTIGTNTIDFYVSNFDDAAYTGDEEGLIVTDFVVVVPETRSYALYFLSTVMLLMLARRWRPGMAGLAV